MNVIRYFFSKVFPISSDNYKGKLQSNEKSSLREVGMDIQKAGVPGITGTQKSAADSLKKTGRALSKILERLATARQINRASDDAAGLAVSEQLRAQARGFRQRTVTWPTPCLP